MGDPPSDDDDGDDGADGDDGGADDGEEDTRVRRLMRAWVAERSAPSVLRWEGDIVDDLMHKVEQQVSFLFLSIRVVRRRKERRELTSLFLPSLLSLLSLFSKDGHGHPPPLGSLNLRRRALQAHARPN